MNSQRPIKKIVALAHSGQGNLGDEATMAAFIDNVRTRLPDAELIALTMDPEKTAEMHKVTAYGVRRSAGPRRAATTSETAAAAPQASGGGILSGLKQFVKTIPLVGTALRQAYRLMGVLLALLADVPFLVRSSRRLRGTDLFVVLGGGQLIDYFGGPWGYPLTILKWCLLARLHGAEVCFLCLGAGPLNTLPGRCMVRWALALSSYRSFRDEYSKRLIEGLGVKGNHPVLPDLVHSLALPTMSQAGSGVVGINPLPYFDPRYWAEENPGVYHRHVDALASFGVWLIQRGYKVHLFPTALGADPPVIEDVAAQIRQRLPNLADGALQCPCIASIEELLAAIAQMEIIVASRFHGAVFSLRSCRPVLALSYDTKTDELMAGAGLQRYVVKVGDADFPWLTARFEQIEVEAADVRRRLECWDRAKRLTLNDQYDRLLCRRAPQVHAFARQQGKATATIADA
jgi:polysaccharide pyruvyl transferase WcaK-like protein